MLDIRLIRDQPDLVKARLATRGPGMEDAVDAVLAADSRRRALETRLQSLQAERNRLSKQIGALRSNGQDTSSIEAGVRSHAAEMQALSEQGALVEQEQKELLLILPNLPQDDVPAGNNSSQNPVVRTWDKLKITSPSPGVSTSSILNARPRSLAADSPVSKAKGRDLNGP
jgi:seryl-tRNA synthetase